MSEADKVSDWIRYFKVVPKLSTLRAVKRNDGAEVLNKVIRGLGLGSALDVIEKCTGDEW